MSYHVKLKKPEHERLVDMLAKGIPSEVIRRELGVPSSTFYAWRAREDVQQALRERLTSRFTSMIPPVLDSIATRASDKNAPLVGLVKAAEFLADRSGMAPTQPVEAPQAMGITLNLQTEQQMKDVTAEAEAKAENERLRVELQTLREEVKALRGDPA